MTSPGKECVKLLLPVGLFCAIAAPSLAADEEKDPAWKSSAELSLVATSGNSEATTFALKYGLSRQWAESRFKLDVSALRAESDTGQRFAVGTSSTDFEVIDPAESEVTAENYSASGRYERDLSEKCFWFLGAGWERNEFAGIENRIVAEAGGGNTWFKTKTAHFLTSYSLTGTRQEDVAQGPGGSETFLGVRLNLDYFRQLTSTTSYAGVLVVDENLDETSDLRANLDQSVSVSISERLALKASLQLLFDNDPALEALALLLPDGTPSGETVLVELDELDSIFKTALVINF